MNFPPYWHHAMPALLDKLQIGMAMTLLLACVGNSQATPLTENQSLQLGLNRTDLLQWQTSRIAQARADLTQQETWINPELELSREELGHETETGIWLRQRLDLAGRRAKQQTAARASLNARQFQISGSRIERAAEIRHQFFESLFHQQQRDQLAHWVAKFTKVETAMGKREAAGDVSGYDRRRISRERISVLARQRESLANYRSAWLQLSGLLGLTDAQGFDGLQGELMPGPLPPLAEIPAAMQTLPTLVHLQYQTEAKRQASAALARGHVPDLTLGLGHKRLDFAGGSDSGLMLSASLSLPLFDRRQGEYQRAQAEHRELESEYRLTRSRLQTQAHSLWQLAHDLAEHAKLFRRQSLAVSNELVEIAETAYRNHELGVLELIDAYRSAMEADLNALQLALEARSKRIELDRLLGEELP